MTLWRTGKSEILAQRAVNRGNFGLSDVEAFSFADVVVCSPTAVLGTVAGSAAENPANLKLLRTPVCAPGTGARCRCAVRGARAVAVAVGVCC